MLANLSFDIFLVFMHFPINIREQQKNVLVMS